MTDTATAYRNVRARMAGVLADATAADLARTVPACPDWTVHDLVAHAVGIPEALAAGQFPSGDLQAWLDGLVEERRDVPVPELLDRWDALDAALDPILAGGGLLLADLLTHEHDLRGALDRPGARDAAEVAQVVPLALANLVGDLSAAGLAPLAVDSGVGRWVSGDGDPGCTLQVDPWEATRVLVSRRTADEIRATPCTGDLEPYLAVIAAHSPLPVASLGERDRA
jgi:hypothetical protein